MDCMYYSPDVGSMHCTTNDEFQRYRNFIASLTTDRDAKFSHVFSKMHASFCTFKHPTNKRKATIVGLFDVFVSQSFVRNGTLLLYRLPLSMLAVLESNNNYPLLFTTTRTQKKTVKRPQSQVVTKSLQFVPLLLVSWNEKLQHDNNVFMHCSID